MCSRAVAMRRRTGDPRRLSAICRTVCRASAGKSSSSCGGMGAGRGAVEGGKEEGWAPVSESDCGDSDEPSFQLPGMGERW